jgi:2,3-bisphosphoglycerate-independent phosphoglycerate mutase
MSTLPFLLLILDGWGDAAPSQHNAIYLAKPSCWQNILAKYPNTLLKCSGPTVGLPQGQMGNSEVGHMTIGAGRVIPQDLVMINNELQQHGKIRSLTPHLQQLAAGANIHILGMLSPGGVHAHEEHMLALTKQCATYSKGHAVYVHAFLDGRDTAPKAAIASSTRAATYLQHYGAHFASVVGRYYAMDRDRRSERTAAALDLLLGKHDTELNILQADDIVTAIQKCYKENISDEFIPPYRLPHFTPIKPGDLVITSNYRADRMRQLCEGLLSAAPWMQLVTMTAYGLSSVQQPPVLFADTPVINTLGECLSQAGIQQCRVAETEKYAHVTFFFNAGQELPFAGEQRCLLASPKVATYDLAPAMSVTAITDTILQRANSNPAQVIIANFANADMVGHTGNLAKTIEAVQHIDRCLQRLLSEFPGSIVITADHGNAECMFDISQQQAHTAHTCNLVPFVYLGPQKLQLRSGGGLCDVAPTVLHLLGLTIPPEMSGTSLIV